MCLQNATHTLFVCVQTASSGSRPSSVYSFRSQGPGLDSHLPKATEGVQASVELRHKIPRLGLESSASTPPCWTVDLGQGLRTEQMEVRYGGSGLASVYPSAEVHSGLGLAWLSLTSPQRCRCAYLFAGVPPGKEEKGLHHGAVVSHSYLSDMGTCPMELTCPELLAQGLPSCRVHVPRRKKT